MVWHKYVSNFMSDISAQGFYLYTLFPMLKTISLDLSRTNSRSFHKSLSFLRVSLRKSDWRQFPPAPFTVSFLSSYNFSSLVGGKPCYANIKHYRNTCSRFIRATIQRHPHVCPNTISLIWSWFSETTIRIHRRKYHTQISVYSAIREAQT